MYYPSGENKGADQLRGYREADLRLCFCLCSLLVFPWGGSFDVGGHNEKSAAASENHLFAGLFLHVKVGLGFWYQIFSQLAEKNPN